MSRGTFSLRGRWGAGTAAQRAVVPHPWRHSRPGWMGPWAARAGGGNQPTAQGRNWMGFKVPSNTSLSRILWSTPGSYKRRLLCAVYQADFQMRTIPITFVLISLCYVQQSQPGCHSSSSLWSNPLGISFTLIFLLPYQRKYRNANCLLPALV